jgi:hypothetical protein
MKWFWGFSFLLGINLSAFATFSNSYQSRVIQSEADLIAVLENTQTSFQGISPPSLDVFLTKTHAPYPVDWSGFSKKSIKYMTAYMDEYGLPRYRLVLWEDFDTRDKVISLAETGYELARIAPSKSYIPEAYYTGLLSRGAAYSDFTRWVFDPAHTAVEIELIPESLYSAYEQNKALEMGTVSPMTMGPPMPIEG